MFGLYVAVVCVSGRISGPADPASCCSLFCLFIIALEWYSYRSNRVVRFVRDWHTSACVGAGYLCFCLEAAVKQRVWFSAEKMRLLFCLRNHVMASSSSSSTEGLHVLKQWCCCYGCVVVRLYFLVVFVSIRADCFVRRSNIFPRPWFWLSLFSFADAPWG